MDFSKEHINFFFFNTEDEEDKIPYIEPYAIREGAYKGKTVRDLVKMGIPGLKALVKVMNAYHVSEYDCANSIIYEMYLEVQNIFDQCDEENYTELLCVLCELYGTLPENNKTCDYYLHCCDDDEEAETLYDLILDGDPADIEEYLEVIIHDITTMPMFVYPVDSEQAGHNIKLDGTCGIVPGMKVAVVLKENQGTDKLDEGIVDEVLTKSLTHPKGIKVKLRDGKIGRVQKIFC